MDKTENFKRLAEKRVQRALNDFRLIGNLSNQANYAYDDETVAHIFTTLESELKRAKLRFQLHGSSGGLEFKIK